MCDTDTSPTYRRHLAEADAALRAASQHLRAIRSAFRTTPDADQKLDEMMPELGRRLHLADMAIGRFRATRECQGSA